ncbi:MAG: GDP-mannose 4,6-dehydratase, partial [Gammaproteobacteria bacterium]|nr:GDP-mannose 4,6-dehydratase [Gammaproteobacteria bacterium]
MRRFLITGGAGFIGSNFVRHWITHNPEDRVVNLDALTYAGNLDSLKDIEEAPNYKFVHGDICDPDLMKKLFEEEKIDTVINFAAES